MLKKTSGIEIKGTEIDVLLEELIEKEKYYESECKDKDEEHEKKVEKEKATAAGMRQKAMQSPGETLKRSRSDSKDKKVVKKSPEKEDQYFLKQSNTYKAKMSHISS